MLGGITFVVPARLGATFPLRHADDHEVEPVPGVFEEGEASATEPSGCHLDGCFKRVDEREHVSGEGEMKGWNVSVS